MTHMHREAETPDGEEGSRALWALKTLSTRVICPDIRTLNCHRLPPSCHDSRLLLSERLLPKLYLPCGAHGVPLPPERANHGTQRRFPPSHEAGRPSRS